MLASLVGFLGGFDLAEEATAETAVIAAERWPASLQGRGQIDWHASRVSLA